MNPTAQHWTHRALALIDADRCRSADTHLIALPLPAWQARGIDLYLKDESTHPTGSLKHRLARSLFLYALCNGWLREGTTVVEAGATIAADKPLMVTATGKVIEHDGDGDKHAVGRSLEAAAADGDMLEILLVPTTGLLVTAA